MDWGLFINILKIVKEIYVKYIQMKHFVLHLLNSLFKK